MNKPSRRDLGVLLKLFQCRIVSKRENQYYNELIDPSIYLYSGDAVDLGYAVTFLQSAISCLIIANELSQRIVYSFL